MARIVSVSGAWGSLGGGVSPVLCEVKLKGLPVKRPQRGLIATRFFFSSSVFSMKEWISSNETDKPPTFESSLRAEVLKTCPITLFASVSTSRPFPHPVVAASLTNS
ncbi:hypothetical protein BDZ45DRAFT_333458 [Acephala macrosclerotiorum]|nr:hypothetical protein BDZ45DRAFT_333458 [Acephala macrosclerotiorum]